MVTGIRGKQKAAALLLSLDAPNAVELLKHLSDEMVQEVALELSRMQAADALPLDTSAILREFYEGLSGERGVEATPRRVLKRVLTAALGDDKADALMKRVEVLAKDTDPFHGIRSARSQAIADVLAGEHPQIVTLILANLPPAKSSEVMAQFPEPLRVEAVRRMADMKAPAVELVHRIAAEIGSKIESQQTGAVEASREERLRQVALVVKGLEPGTKLALLNTLAAQDRETADTIRQLMFVWDDLLTVADRPLQQILRDFDDTVLARSLAGAEEAVRRRITSNISRRAAERLQEESELLGPLKPEEVQEARAQILSALRAADERGELMSVQE